MINECLKKDLPRILHVINEAAMKYKGIIPEDCWHEPYMSKTDLDNEISNGLRMFGYKKNNNIVGVIGIQQMEVVTLIRHAYILTDYQGKGIGKKLLTYLLETNKKNSLLVGAWSQATWAIDFYKKFGFVQHNKKQTIQLLEKYWDISAKQINNSVVLEK